MKSNKITFLEQPKTEWQIPASYLPVVTKYYKDKYNINILINGESDYGKKIIKQHNEKNEELLRLQDNPNKYAIFLKRHWHSPDSTNKIEKWDIAPHPPSEFADNYFKLKDRIQEFLDEKGNLRDLTSTECEALNKIITTMVIKTEFDRQIKNQPHFLNLADKCLDRGQAIEEVAQIQKSLYEQNKNEIVGYVYTNNHRIETDHFEVLIIDSNNLIVKPVVWDPGESKEINLINQESQKYASADISDFVSQKLLPQAGYTRVCGTLGMLYLKELLKDNAKQLKEFSLIVPFYNKEKKVCNLFVPSPDVLRYSHSTSYNLAIKAMVANDGVDPVFIKHESKITVKPLSAIIEETKKVAISKKHTAIVEQCDDLLKYLPIYRNKWLHENEKANRQRESMIKDESNLYLDYKSSNFRERQAVARSSSENITLSLFTAKKQNKPVKLDDFIPIYEELDRKRNMILDEMIHAKNFDIRPILNLLIDMRTIAMEFEKNQDYSALDKSLSSALHDIQIMQEITKEMLDKYDVEEISNKIRASALAYSKTHKDVGFKKT